MEEKEIVSDRGGGHLRRKRRRIGRKVKEEDGEEDIGVLPEVDSPISNKYDFLSLASFILEWDIPILFSGGARPRNSHALIGAGGSFLVFNEVRTMDDVVIKPEELRSLADKMVLKRTRSTQQPADTRANEEAGRYQAVMAELQILTHPSIAEHENIIDLLGLTWDYEPGPDGTQSVWPVLALEAAECSMETLMQDLRDAPAASKIKYCHDVAKALEFLHARGVVHCDVKPENVLICVNSFSGSVAKLSDFGSALLGVTSDSHFAHGIVGTRPWNAPEYGTHLMGLDVMKTDVFSFGMLFWWFIGQPAILNNLLTSQEEERAILIEQLEEEKRNDTLISLGLEDIEHCCASLPGIEDFITMIHNTLSFKPVDRWSMRDLNAVLENLVQQLTGTDDESDHKIDEMSNKSTDTSVSLDNSTTSTSSHSQVEEDDRIIPIPSVPFYNDFKRFYERFEEESVPLKTQLVESLKKWATRKQLDFDAGEAAYQLSLCYINGFGVETNLEQGFNWTLKAAGLGSQKAQAEAYRLYEAVSSHSDNFSVEIQNLTQWLTEATKLGSYQAANDLHDLDPLAFGHAMTSWRQRFCTIDGVNGGKVPTEADLLALCHKVKALTTLNELPLNDRGHRLIHLCSSLGYEQGLQELVSNCADINICNNEGETALLCACRAGHASIALQLLELGADVKEAKSGASPLHWIIALDEDSANDVARALVSRGANLEQQCLETEANEYVFDVYPHGTPLDWAVSKRKMAAIRTLVELEADPFNECSEYSPFVRAVSVHSVEVLQVLLQSVHATADRLNAFDSTGQSLLFHAIYCNQPHERILEHGLEYLTAARDTIQTLINHGCEPSCVDKDGNNLLHLAAGFCDYDFLKLLLDDFELVNMINTPCGEAARTPIHHAIASRKLEVLKLLISRGADTYCVSNNKTLLHLCATIEDEEYAIFCVEAIGLQDRSDLDAVAVNSEAPQGLTAFELAVLSGHLKLAQVFLANGADSAGPHGMEPHFLTLLITDPAWYSPQSLQFYLRECQCPFIIMSANQLSVLHTAASLSSIADVADNFTAELKLDMLLEKYSEPEQINAKTTRSDLNQIVGGRTPLHYAAKGGVYHAARKLLQVGASANAVDDLGRTPLDLAREELFQIRELLMPHERPRGLSDYEDTVKLLELAIAGEALPTMRRNTTVGEYTRLNFSRLGFQTGS